MSHTARSSWKQSIRLLRRLLLVRRLPRAPAPLRAVPARRRDSLLTLTQHNSAETPRRRQAQDSALHVVPHGLPLLPPRERPVARLADLGGQVSFVRCFGLECVARRSDHAQQPRNGQCGRDKHQLFCRILCQHCCSQPQNNRSCTLLMNSDNSCVCARSRHVERRQRVAFGRMLLPRLRTHWWLTLH